QARERLHDFVGKRSCKLQISRRGRRRWQWQYGDRWLRADRHRGRRTHPESRQVAALVERDLEWRVDSLAVVVAVEPLPQAAGLDAHDGVGLRIVGAGGTAEEINAQGHLAQGGDLAGQLACDQMAQELLMPQRVTERRTLADAIELRGNRVRPDRISRAHSSWAAVATLWIPRAIFPR